VVFETTIDGPGRKKTSDDDDTAPLCLVVVWAHDDQDRIGEVLFPTDGAVFGRGPLEDDQDHRVGLVRQEPQKNVRAALLESPFLSRKALKLGESGDAIEIEVLGKKAIRLGDAEMRVATIREGDVFEIDGLYSFFCTRRPTFLPDSPGVTRKRFGHVDDHGIVGESPAAWSLRTSVAFFAKRNAHVLVTGPSGTGKELVAQALHRLSARGKKELVSRNAATFPSSLIDAELFGNVANYPNAGMPERPGIIGQVDGSTLFLDEIGELPTDLQAHLLRVLDSGEYQRLGDSRKRIADFRLIAATNRAASELKEDVAARLGLRVHLPGLDERREDIPLLARHLLVRAAARDPQMKERFFAGDEPGLDADLVRALVLHDYTTHVRELEGFLWKSASTSKGNSLELTKDVAKMITVVARPAPRELAAAHIQAALAKHGGVKDKAWRELGLPSRHALHRLMKKMNIPD
jgi:two-component system nitrogen regulation response regulator GlnG/two-component system response regulator HydG